MKDTRFLCTNSILTVECNKEGPSTSYPRRLLLFSFRPLLGISEDVRALGQPQSRNHGSSQAGKDAAIGSNRYVSSLNFNVLQFVRSHTEHELTLLSQGKFICDLQSSLSNNQAAAVEPRQSPLHICRIQLEHALIFHDFPSGKGTPRRKVKKVHKSSGTDDKKLQTSLKKLNVQPIQAIEEVNMFKEDGNVIHFAAPKGETSSIP